MVLVDKKTNRDVNNLGTLLCIETDINSRFEITYFSEVQRNFSKNANTEDFLEVAFSRCTINIIFRLFTFIIF